MSIHFSPLVVRPWAWLIALTASTCLAAEPGAKALTVVMDDNYPPYVFRDSSGALDGYLVDFWALWARKTGVHVDLVATDWGKAQARMASGQADVIDTIFRTPAREAVLDFTPPYATIPVTIYTHASIGGITDLKNLHGFLVGVKAGDACAEKLSEAGIVTQQPYVNYQALIQAAASQQIRVFCLDEPPANYLLYRSHVAHDFHKAFELYTGEFHRAVHKGDAKTMSLLTRGLDAITPTERQALQDKWMGRDLGMTPYGRYLGSALLVAAAVGSVLVLWGMTLRRVVKQRTAQLETERGRLRTLVQTIPDLVWLKDAQGRFLGCNPVFERFIGAPEAEVIGKHCTELVDKAMADHFLERDQQTLAQGMPNRFEDWLTFAENKYRCPFGTAPPPLPWPVRDHPHALARCDRAPDGRAGHCPRHHPPQGGRGRDQAPGLLRQPHQAAQPPLAARPLAPRAGRQCPAWPAGCFAVHRPGQLQIHQ